MKKYYLIAFAIAIQFQLLAQDVFNEKDSTYTLKYLKFQTMSPDTIFDSPYNKARRYLYRYSGYVDNNGDFNTYASNLVQLQNSINSSNSSNSGSSPNSINFGNWSELGPYKCNLPYELNVGRIMVTQVDSDDPSGNTIYVLSDAGGLFKTVNGGINWINYFTDYSFSSLVFSDFKLVKDNLTNKKFIYLASGGSGAQATSVLWRLEIGTTNWVNLTGNLTCNNMLGSTRM